MLIPDFVMEAVKSGVKVEILPEGFRLWGFYKSDSVELAVNCDGAWFAKDRYNDTCLISELNDLVELNFDWWERSKDRYVGWNQPDEGWADLLVKFGYIVEEVIPVKKVYAAA